jgi:hypothetical protein
VPLKDRGDVIPNLIFGTANLFGLVQPEDSEALIRTAHNEGIQHFDTAPSYGYGCCEPAVGRLVRSFESQTLVTTKVGISAATRPSALMRYAKSGARRLPGSLRHRVRGGATRSGHGRFSADYARDSIEQSLRRLGRIDRLMLHEATPDNITDELISCLTRYVSRGDIDILGVATTNELTRPCLMRAPEIFTAAHIAIGPFAVPVDLPDNVTARVGHGIFGPRAADLHRLATLRSRDLGVGARWYEATRGTVCDTRDGLAAALLARAMTLDLTEVIFATSHPSNIAKTCEFVGNGVRVEPVVLALLEEMVELSLGLRGSPQRISQ